MAQAEDANKLLGQILDVNKRMESQLNAIAKGTSNSGGNVKQKTETPVGNQDFGAMASLVKEITKLLATSSIISPTSGKKLAGIIGDISKSITELVNSIDEDKIDSFTKMLSTYSASAKKFMKDMAVIAFIGPVSYLGIQIFGRGLLALNNILSKATESKKETISGIDAIFKMASGSVKFMLTMALVTVISPLYIAGILVFSLGIISMIGILSTVGAAKGLVDKGINEVMALAGGATKFILTMSLVTLVAPIFYLGILIFSLGVASMMGILAGAAIATPVTNKGLDEIGDIVRGSAFFVLSMVLVSFVIAPFALGILVFSLGVSAMLLILGTTAALTPAINRGVHALTKIRNTALILSLTFLLVGLMAPTVAIGAVTVSLSMMAVGLAAAFVGGLSKLIDRGIRPLYQMSGALVIFSAALLILGASVNEPMTLMGQIAAIGASIVVLGTAAFLLGVLDTVPIPKAVTIGAGVLLLLSATMVVFSSALFILSKTNFTSEQADNLGYTILILGTSLAATGLMIPLILLGTAAITIATPGILFMSLGLAAFKASGFKGNVDDSGRATGDAANLQGAIRAIISGFSSVNILEAAYIAIIGPLMAVASLGIYGISSALKAFKEVGWKGTVSDDGRYTGDSENLYGAIRSVVSSFVDSFDNVSIAQMFKVSYGITVLSGISGALRGLAEGISAMSDLKFVEYEVVKDPATGMNKIQPARVVSLTQDDFAKVGVNIGKIITSLSKPLAEVGMIETGMFSNIFGGGYISAGIDALSGIGNVLTSLAEGISSMANMEVVEYQVVKNANGVNEIQPIGRRKLTESDFTNAGKNVTAILTSLAKPLTEFGIAFKSGSSWFTDSALEAGIEGLSAISDPISNLAKGVLSMANLEVTEYEIVGDGANRKLVPKSVTKLTPEHFTKVGINVSKILGALAEPLNMFGTIINQGYIEDGLDALDKVANPINQMAETVKLMATGDFLINELVDDGHGGKKLVPSKMISIEDAIPKAIANITQLLTTYPNALIAFSRKFADSEDDFETALDLFEPIGQLMVEVKTLGETWTSLWEMFTKAEATGSPTATPDLVLTSYINNINKLAKVLNDDITDKSLQKYVMFNNQIKNLSDVATPFEKFVKSFGEMSKHMGVFANNFKIMNPDGITAFEKWTKSVENLANVDIRKMPGILDWVNNIASAGYRREGGIPPETESNLITQRQRIEAVESANRPRIQEAATERREPALQQPQINTVELAAAIVNGLKSAGLKVTIEGISESAANRMRPTNRL